MNVYAAVFAIALLAGQNLLGQRAGAEGFQVPRQEHPMLNNKDLPHATWYHAPIQADLIDPRPILHNCLVPQEQSPTILIDGATMQPTSGPKIMMTNQQSGQAPGYRTDSPGVRPLSELPRSRFGSNMASPMLSPASSLPNGFSVGVHANIKPGAQVAGVAPRFVDPVERAPQAVQQRTPNIASYPRPAISIGSSRKGTASTSVTGELMLRKVRDKFLHAQK